MWYVKIEWLYAIGITFLVNLTTGYQPKIVIIGAGSSGIAAASKLYERGFRNVTILEAENRIGGRVYTKNFDNKLVDLGGQTVHGQVGNFVYELASPLGLLEVPEAEEFDFVIYNSNGCQVEPSIAHNMIEIYAQISEMDPQGENGTIGEFYTELLNTPFENVQTVNESLKNSFVELFEKFTVGSDTSDNWHNTSARGYAEFWEQAGSITVNWKDKGYGMLFDLLTKKYPNPDEELPVLNNTLLNTEVVNINYNTSNGKALVETSNGEKYEADHVIVTTSLGVLKKRHETLFTPRLPESKLNTINGLAFGTAGKIFLSFEEEWWPSNWTNVGFIWEENVRREYENDPDKKWLLDLVALWKLPHKPRVLAFWVNGPGSRYMETLPEEQVFNQTVSFLNRFLGKSFNISRPTKILRTNWYTNEHFLGTYSYRSMESERTDAWAKDLAAPLLINNSQPIVLFAGEATNSHRFGTVDGAVETGIREANRLIDIYKDILD